MPAAKRRRDLPAGRGDVDDLPEPPRTHGRFPWKIERDGKEVRSRAEGQLILDDPDLAATLMIAGAGLGLILEPKALPHLSAGRLVQVLNDWRVPFQGLHIYYPSRHVTPALRALIDALRWKLSDA